MITYRITTLFIPLQQTMYVVWVEIVFAHSSAPKECKQIVEKINYLYTSLSTLYLVTK